MTDLFCNAKVERVVLCKQAVSMGEEVDALRRALNCDHDWQQCNGNGDDFCDKCGCIREYHTGHVYYEGWGD